MFWDPAPRRYPFLIPGQIFVWNLFVAHFFVRISSSAFLRLRISLSCISLSRISLYAQFLVLHFFVSAKIRLHSYSYRKYPSTQIFVHISLSANLRPQIFVRKSSSAFLCLQIFVRISSSAFLCPQILVRKSSHFFVHKCSSAFLHPQIFCRRNADKDLRMKICRQRFADKDLRRRIFAIWITAEMNFCGDKEMQYE